MKHFWKLTFAKSNTNNYEHAFDCFFTSKKKAIEHIKEITSNKGIEFDRISILESEHYSHMYHIYCDNSLLKFVPEYKLGSYPISFKKEEFQK
jgi:hypothetical protein